MACYAHTAVGTQLRECAARCRDAVDAVYNTSQQWGVQRQGRVAKKRILELVVCPVAPRLDKILFRKTVGIA